MEYSVPIPLDFDGFLRRQCPTCGEQFKWHHGPFNEKAESAPPADLYYCPLCGQPAVVNEWMTPEQLAFAQAEVMPKLLRQLADEMPGLTITDSPSAPPALTEPNDMQIIASPCHDYEPVKVPDEREAPFYCLVCGAAYAV
ncbi:hypothetical protein IU470_30255 [Nocardia abscessus]|uniref:Uncharacterized protein n=1 Tax=Nocardia abscessus TaxID=120957 RepID=A0ABS0CHD2_9NOCA|nr:hypothetical protein [Nocardia abscessus]